MRYRLPDAVGQIANARNQLKQHYSESKLSFTPDGKLVGDLGEAVAAQMFDIDLDAQAYIDGYAKIDNRPVQIKATGRPKGSFLFRPCHYEYPEKIHLIALVFNWDSCDFEVVYNGKEEPVRPTFGLEETGQKSLSVNKVRAASHDSDNALPINPDFMENWKI